MTPINYRRSLILSALLLACTAFVACTREESKGNTITISGTVEFPDTTFPITVYQLVDGNVVVLDTIPLRDDHSFSHKLTITEPGRYTLDIQKWESLDFWGEDEDIQANFRGQDTAKIKIKNPPYEMMINPGPSNALMNHINYVNYIAYQRMIEAAQLMYRASLSGSQPWIDDTRNALDVAYDKDRRDYNMLAKMYPDANSAIVLLHMLKEDSPEYNELLEHLKATKAEYPPFKKWLTEKELREERLRSLAKGNPAPHFTMLTRDAQEVTFDPEALFAGKVLVVDFWASWCGPCRKAVPALKELYDKYASKGVEIVSVSIDKDEKDWKKALQEEAMPWSQYLAPEAGKEVMDLYQFNGIPHFVLLDREGHILDRQLGINNLEEGLLSALE